jgi:hypothetical protein
MPTIYALAQDPSAFDPPDACPGCAMGGTNDKLARSLSDPEPEERAKTADAIAWFRVYLALPHLVDMLRDETDPLARQSANDALAQLLQPAGSALERILGVEAPEPTAERDGHTQLQDAETAIELFDLYVASRQSRSSGPSERDIVEPVVHYLADWGDLGARQLDEPGLLAAQAIGAIARFLEIPPRKAGIKAMTYGEARGRVARYRKEG